MIKVVDLGPNADKKSAWLAASLNEAADKMGLEWYNVRLVSVLQSAYSTGLQAIFDVSSRA
jgi:hypothetical protein